MHIYYLRHYHIIVEHRLVEKPTIFKLIGYRFFSFLLNIGYGRHSWGVFKTELFKLFSNILKVIWQSIKMLKIAAERLIRVQFGFSILASDGTPGLVLRADEVVDWRSRYRTAVVGRWYYRRAVHRVCQYRC